MDDLLSKILRVESTNNKIYDTIILGTWKNLIDRILKMV